MTEEQWIVCTDPDAMLSILFYSGVSRPREIGSERNYRLLAYAFCRGVWSLLGDERSRKAIETAERYIDQAASDAEMTRAWNTALAARVGCSSGWPEDQAAEAVCCAVRQDEHYRYSVRIVAEKARAAAWAAGREVIRHRQTAAIRDIFGFALFRQPSLIQPAVLAWNDGTVRKLAQLIDDDRAFDRLPLLADALEDAGCTDAAILSHCREPGEHVRGCWVVDLLLGKS